MYIYIKYIYMIFKEKNKKSFSKKIRSHCGYSCKKYYICNDSPFQ